jgi:hypothetical protein
MSNNIKKLRERVKEAYATFDSIEEIIFTTYDFSIDFFEDSLIAYLAGIDKITNVNHIHMLNQWLKENTVSVYYDSHGLMNLEKRLTYSTYSIGINNGVFHPKIILMFGKKNNKNRAYLFVSSANLTVSGYARNREGFIELEVENKEVALGLEAFLEELYKYEKDEGSNHEALLNHLKEIKKTNKNIEFFSSWNKSESLISYITKETRKITVISPYFNEKLNDYITSISKRCSEIIIIPSIHDEKEVQIKRSEYEKLKDKASFKRLSFKESLFIHGKIYIGDNIFVVGSHNFTSKAAGTFTKKGDNIEASIVLKDSDNTISNISDFNDIEEYLMPDDKDLKQDYVENIEGMYINLRVDWKEEKVILDYIKCPKHIVIKVAGEEILSSSLKEEIVESHLNEKLKNIFIKHKYFEAYEDGKVFYKGLINESNWENYRAELICTSLDEIFSCWIAEDYSELKEKNYKGRLKAVSENTLEDFIEYSELDLVTNNRGDIFDNYFYLFKVYRLQKARIDECKVDKDKLYSLYKTLPGSFYNLYELFKKELLKQEKDSVWKWINLNELFIVSNKLKEGLSNKYEQEINSLSSEIKKHLYIVEEGLDNSETMDKEYLHWIKNKMGYL